MCIYHISLYKMKDPIKKSKRLLLFLPLLSLLAIPLRAQEPAEGNWKQLVWTTNRWKELGVFRLHKESGMYLMHPVEQVESPTVINSKGLFNVQVSQEKWSFSSDWGNGDIGQFELTRVWEGIYIGKASLNGQVTSLNLWLKVE